MNATIFTTVFNRKGKLLSNGTALIQIRAYLNGRCKFFSTNIYISPTQWDKKHNLIKNHPNAIRLNKQIADFTTRLQAFEMEQLNKGKKFNIDCYNEFVSGRFSNSFYDFINREIEENNTTAKATKVTQRTTLKALREYKSDVSFDDVTFDFLTGFQRFLTAKSLSKNTINKYFRHIRRFVNLAIDRDKIELNKYPFRKFKAEAEQTERTHLSISELQQLEKLQIPTDKAHLQKSLDMFLFSCYCGLRFSDVVRISNNNIKDIDGCKWLEIRTQKTNIPIRLPISLLNSNLTNIISRYESAEANKFLFENITNQYINRSLKEVAKLAQINKVLTFHVARHTFATTSLYKGVPMEVLKSLLGHTKITTTEIYGKITSETVVKQLSMVHYG